MYSFSTSAHATSGWNKNDLSNLSGREERHACGTSVHGFRGVSESIGEMERHFVSCGVNFCAVTAFRGVHVHLPSLSFPSPVPLCQHSPPLPAFSSPNTWPLDQATKAEACLRVDYSNVCGTCAKRNVVKPCAALPALSH